MLASAYVLINIEGNRVKPALNRLFKIKGVKSAHAVAGPYDIIAFIQAKDLESLGNTVVSKVRKIPGIAQTMTCVTVSV